MFPVYAMPQEPVSKLRVNRVGSACLRACLSDYARSQATHRQAATESFEIGSQDMIINRESIPQKAEGLRKNEG